MKLQTLTKLQDQLDKEFSWRIKEIADLKSAVKSNRSTSASTLIRAGVPLLYAHWEGFVKKSVEAYINFVSCQKLKLSELSSNFVTLGVKNQLQTITSSRKTKANIEIVEFFRSGMLSSSPLRLSAGVNTCSNLSSTVFENIAETVGINCSNYEARYKFIDSSLLERRNNIAHGEFLELDVESFRNLADEVIVLLRIVKNDIQNLASLGNYRLPHVGGVSPK